MKTSVLVDNAIFAVNDRKKNYFLEIEKLKSRIEECCIALDNLEAIRECELQNEDEGKV